MSDAYALPDPLPDRLPGESSNTYRRRVVPGWKEIARIRRRWTQFSRRRLDAFRADHGYTDDMPQAQADAVLDRAWDDWCAAHPDRSARFVELHAVVPWVVPP